MNNKTVLEVITDRISARNKGTSLKDGHILGLAVAGGGMRGIVSAGMVIALQDLDMLDIFDYYTGVSAGSFNLAYVLTGQAALGLSIYFEDMTNKNFINLLRFRKSDQPIVDIRRLYSATSEHRYLEVDKLRQAYGDSFRVAVSNVTTNRGELVSVNDSEQYFNDFLISGAIIPFIAGAPWVINGNKYYDGALFYPEPTIAAQELHCTHTLTLSTRGQNQPIRQSSRFIENRMRRFDKDYPGLSERYFKGLSEAAQTYNLLPYGETQIGDMRVYRHALKRSSGVKPLTADTESLLKGLKLGYQSILDLFNVEGQVGIKPTQM